MNPTPPSERRPQRIAVLPGDGSGKDVTAEAVKVLAAAAGTWSLPLELISFDWDADRYLRTGETAPAAAFEYAVAHGRREVMMSDKSNVMLYGHGLWRRVFAEVAKEYPQIQTRTMFVDALCMEMVLRPEGLDVIVTNNMFGDIITDLGAALQGGLGVAASANLHPGQTSMFEPVHGSAPALAGTGKANPVGAVLSAAMMLDYLGHQEAAQAGEAAVASSMREGQTTPDLGGSLTTSQVGDLLARAVE